MLLHLQFESKQSPFCAFSVIADFAPGGVEAIHAGNELAAAFEEVDYRIDVHTVR